MFRPTATGPFDEAIAKATDENLTAEDWGAIMEVCDRVTHDANGPKETVKSIIKRLAHRNANVQLYTLELANALSQNCGKEMHRELCSRAFTDALLRLASDRNTHAQVKSKVLERMKDWVTMFSDDPDLGIMADAHTRLRSTFPNLQPPSAPQKNSLTDLDRQKEDAELQMALKLSLQEDGSKEASGSGPSASAGASADSAASAVHPTGQSSAGDQTDLGSLAATAGGSTPAMVSRVRALYDFQPAEPTELEFKRGDVIAVIGSVYKDWWRGSLKGHTGIFPLNYVEKLSDPTPDELQREAQMEAEVFAEIKNVEKLLTLLSTSNNVPKEEDNEEISKLYHHTLGIRPKLIKLIEKYSQKKDDFTQLNEKFIKARRDYEALLESSMSQPPQHTYHPYSFAPPPPPQSYQTPSAAGLVYPYQPHPQQEPQRIYSPPPVVEQFQHSQSSPSPTQPIQRPAQSTPAPFYIAGNEVPSHTGPPPTHSYLPFRDQQARVDQHGRQPAPPQAPSSPPPPQAPQGPQGSYQAPYAHLVQPHAQMSDHQHQHQRLPRHESLPQQFTPQPLAQQQLQYQQSQLGGGDAGVPPQSTYGGAQELATSAYDSPVAQHNVQSTAPYSSATYPSDERFAGGEPVAQQSYAAYHPAPVDGPPPIPMAQPRNSISSIVYGGPTAGPPQPTSDSAYNPRHSALPGHLTQLGLGAAGPSGPSTLPSYRPYVPSAAAEPSAPPAAPADYYRQNGNAY